MEQMSQEEKSINEAHDKHNMWISSLIQEYDNLLEDQSIENSPNTRIMNVRKIWNERRHPPIFKYIKSSRNIKN